VKYIVLYIIFLLIIVSGFKALVFVISLFRRSSSVIDEFEEQFPGRCGVCARHAYGIREGFLDRGSVPEDHRCPEKLARWRGALH
jgi:hypothetical protein